MDNRALVNIAFTGEAETMHALGVPLSLTWHDLKGPVTGFLLWDPERRLVAYQQSERDMEGNHVHGADGLDGHDGHRADEGAAGG